MAFSIACNLCFSSHYSLMNSSNSCSRHPRMKRTGRNKYILNSHISPYPNDSKAKELSRIEEFLSTSHPFVHISVPWNLHVWQIVSYTQTHFMTSILFSYVDHGHKLFSSLSPQCCQTYGLCLVASGNDHDPIIIRWTLGDHFWF